MPTPLPTRRPKRRRRDGLLHELQRRVKANILIFLGLVSFQKKPAEELSVLDTLLD
jgi:hypothetical protein